MFIFLLFSCFLVIASSDGAVITKGQDVAAVTDWLHRISKRHSSELEARQDNNACLNQFRHDLPSDCNFTRLSDSLSNVVGTLYPTDAQLTDLNNAYAQICVSACIDPIETYYDCEQIDNKDYLITLIRHGSCGQESGDYCPVRFLREYEGDYSSYAQLLNSCPSHNSGGGISCSGASSTCLDSVNTFSERMGCCTEPYLGSGVTSCSGVSVDEPCTGVSSATGLVAPVFVMILSLVGFLV